MLHLVEQIDIVSTIYLRHIVYSTKLRRNNEAEDVESKCKPIV